MNLPIHLDGRVNSGDRRPSLGSRPAKEITEADPTAIITANTLNLDAQDEDEDSELMKADFRLRRMRARKLARVFGVPAPMENPNIKQGIGGGMRSASLGMGIGNGNGFVGPTPV